MGRKITGRVTMTAEYAAQLLRDHPEWVEHNGVIGAPEDFQDEAEISNAFNGRVRCDCGCKYWNNYNNCSDCGEFVGQFLDQVSS